MYPVLMVMQYYVEVIGMCGGIFGVKGCLEGCIRYRRRKARARPGFRSIFVIRPLPWQVRLLGRSQNLNKKRNFLVLEGDRTGIARDLSSGVCVCLCVLLFFLLSRSVLYILAWLYTTQRIKTNEPYIQRIS